MCVYVRERERNREGEVEICYCSRGYHTSEPEWTRKRKRRVDGDSGIRVWWRKNQEKKKKRKKKGNIWMKERKRIRNDNLEILP